MSNPVPNLFFSSGLVLTTVLLAFPDGSAAAPVDADLFDAFVAFYPMHEMARLRYIAVDDPANPVRVGINQFQHGRRLLDHRARVVTAPNNDTIYSSARLDLRNGPVQVEMPRIPKRYYSLQFMNAYTDNIALPGSRTHGEGPMSIVVVGPGWSGAVPAHSLRIDSDTNDLWLLGRVLVDGKEDLPNVAAIQAAMQIKAPAGDFAGLKSAPVKDPDPEQFLAVVNDMLARNPPQGLMLERQQAAAGLGIVPGAVSNWRDLPQALRARWKTQWPLLWSELQQLRRAVPGIGRHASGWEFPPPGVGRWGSNLNLRAAVALRGIAALDSEEVLYLNAIADAAGQRLDGQARYRIRVPAGAVPVDAFWSITMYEVMPDGRFFFADNPIGRYSVGDRTRGLVKNSDGTIDLWLQADAPNEADRLANWLPTPRSAFRMSLRAYLPKPELVAGTAPLPTIDRLSP